MSRTNMNPQYEKAYGYGLFMSKSPNCIGEENKMKNVVYE